MRRWIVVLLVVGFGWALSGHNLQAAKAPNNAPRKAAPAHEVTARLPRYFGQLELDKQQKAEVYAIQVDYGEQIKKLREELADVQQQRDQDLQKVLTPAQRKAFSRRTGQTRTGKTRTGKTRTGKTSAKKSSTSKSPTRRRKKTSRRST